MKWQYKEDKPFGRQRYLQARHGQLAYLVSLPTCRGEIGRGDQDQREAPRQGASK